MIHASSERTSWKVRKTVLKMIIKLSRSAVMESIFSLLLFACQIKYHLTSSKHYSVALIDNASQKVSKLLKYQTQMIGCDNSVKYCSGRIFNIFTFTLQKISL